MNGEKVYLAHYGRSAFSRSRPKEPEKDVFNSLRMDEVLAGLINDSIDKTGVKPSEVNDVITGCALQVLENWTYGGRHPVLLSKLPDSVPGMSLDRACSSSLNAITIGAMEISTGNADIVLAGGMEHMTHVPLNDNEHVKANVRLLVRPEYLKHEMNIGYSMGLTAEKLASLKGIKREEMDRYSAESHQRAAKAQEDGYFKGEIVPVQAEFQGKEITIDKDQSIRPETTLEKLAALPPAFKQGGVITAGNSSPLNAGASLVMLMSEKKVKEYGIKPLSSITSFGWAAVPPSIMGQGVVPASQKALDKAGMKPEDIDIYEFNEAFAAVPLNAMKELGIDREKVNVNGGAIAIGHPLGASGARLAGTLSRLLNSKGKDRGLASLCVGGGQGYTAIFERV
ncbi:MAG: acetyl-CoA C-acetyltransferase [Candidatus Thermoplasmatota archaeon]|jgi:acetyl-CoA C-acetyltransferase|nr:acetyl-CoA C-acetyltransferase [Candidatus Thermoplasmatota archaeon]